MKRIADYADGGDFAERITDDTDHRLRRFGDDTNRFVLDEKVRDGIT
jgi:hypothetical protein